MTFVCTSNQISESQVCHVESVANKHRYVHFCLDSLSKHSLDVKSMDQPSPVNDDPIWTVCCQRSSSSSPPPIFKSSFSCLSSPTHELQTHCCLPIPCTLLVSPSPQNLLPREATVLGSHAQHIHISLGACPGGIPKTSSTTHRTITLGTKGLRSLATIRRLTPGDLVRI